jgi:hypothetical protein
MHFTLDVADAQTSCRHLPSRTEHSEAELFGFVVDTAVAEKTEYNKDLPCRIEAFTITPLVESMSRLVLVLSREITLELKKSSHTMKPKTFGPSIHPSREQHPAWKSSLSRDLSAADSLSKKLSDEETELSREEDE